jgi:Ca2+-binding RTX toxin-like protein
MSNAQAWYDFAIQQVAAESYLDDVDLESQDDVVRALKLGSNNLRPNVYENGIPKVNGRFGRFESGEVTDILPGASRLTSIQADYLYANWRLVEQYRNDPSGFSATLLQHRTTGEYTLSFRSTEYSQQIDGGDYERDVDGADRAGIFLRGFALAQLAGMERYYAELKASGILPAGAALNVTGYSLGGHLATVFTELHAPEVKATYLFNAPGRGALKEGIGSIGQLIDAYDRILADPAYAVTAGLIAEPVSNGTPEENAVYALYQAAISSEGVDWGGRGNIYLTARHRWAEQVLERYSSGTLRQSLFQDEEARISPAAEQKITYIYGMGSHGDEVATVNSGITPGTFEQKVRVLIEDQPDRYGALADDENGAVLREADFLRTHSITLLIDALAVINLFRKVDPELTQAEVETIIAASSNQRASVSSSYEGAFVEGDSLERAVDSLARILLGQDTPALTYDASPDGFGHIGNREAFYARIAQIEDWLSAHPDAGLHIDVIPAMRWEQVLKLATIRGLEVVPEAIDDGPLVNAAEQSVAYRYALRELNPYALYGSEALYEGRSPDGELDLYDPQTGRGMSAAELRARVEMALAHYARNIADSGGAYGDAAPNALYSSSSIDPVTGAARESFDVSGTRETQARFSAEEQYSNELRDAEIARLMGERVLSGLADRVAFGSAGDDKLAGGGARDRLFGGGGDDVLEGGGDDDLLEGGAGADLLVGGAGNDILDGRDARGGDRLRGGTGYDTYYVDAGDSIADDPESPRGGIIYAGPARLQLGEAYRTGRSGFFSGAGGVRYWESSDGRIAAYLEPGTPPVMIEAPAAAVPGREAIGNVEVSGRPDLGIRLVSLLEDRPALRPATSVWDLYKQALTWRPYADPLALDLDGDGVETLGGEPGRAVLFDHTGIGVRNGTGWLSGDDAWLVRDLDGDGLITRGAELFGIDTRLPNGTLAADGFAALASLDANGDGRVSDADAYFGDLQLWRDANLNGISEPFELRSLAEEGIASISLVSQASGQALPGGNILLKRGSYTRADGSVGAVGALNLVREMYYRDFSVAPAAAGVDDALPDLAGTGRVRDLAEAGAESSAVASALQAAAGASSREAQRALAGDLVAAWAESSAMSPGRRAAAERSDRPLLYYRFGDLAQTSAAQAWQAAVAGGVPPGTVPDGWYDAQQGAEYRERVRKLEILERFVGQTFADVGSAGAGLEALSGGGSIRTLQVSIGYDNWVFLDQAYAALEDSVYLSVALQSRLAGYVDAFTRGQATRDFSELEGLFAAKRAADPAGALADFVDLSRGLGTQLVERGWIAQPAMLERWVRDAAADPALAALLPSLKIRFRDDYQIVGSGIADLMLGSDWVPPPAPLAGVWRTYGGLGDDLLIGGEYRDTEIYDGPGRDLVLGGPEVDVFLGGAGRDIYLFGRGSGQDRLEPEPHLQVTALDRDVLQFMDGVRPEDVVARRVYDPSTGSTSLELRIEGTADVFTDRFFFHTEDGGPRMLDEVRFADGTVWGLADIRAHAVTGTEGDDNGAPGRAPRILGTPLADTINGLGGDDLLMGDAGDDVLLGGAGADTLEGDRGDDLLDGGPGADFLYGGFGVDRYMLRRGGGRDEIFRGNFITWAGTESFTELDVVRPEEGIGPDELLVRWSPAGTRFFLADGSAELFDHGNPLNPFFLAAGGAGPSVGRVEFADGTIWDSARIRAQALLGATEAADTVIGYADTDDLLHGLGGDDILAGGAGDDLLDGGEGNDRLYGGAGRDTYVLRRGGGSDDVYAGNPGGFADDGLSADADILLVEAGVSPEALALEWRNGLLHVGLADGSAQILDHGNPLNPSYTGGRGPAIGRIEFADGTAWDANQIRARTVFAAGDGEDLLIGFDDSADVLRGFGGGDYIFGGAGDDLIEGGPGDDWLEGGEGADTYVFGPGDGRDEIHDDASGLADANTLRIRGVQNGWLLRQGNRLEIHGTQDGVLLSGANAISTVVFDDGSRVDLASLPTSPPASNGGGSGPGGGLPPIFQVPPVYGVGVATNGDDFIYGTLGRDVLAGGPGNDWLYGHAGADTYLFGRGDGIDIVVDLQDADGPNVLRFGPGISPADLEIFHESPFHGYVIAATGDAIAFAGDEPVLQFTAAEAAEDGPEAGNEVASAGAVKTEPAAQDSAIDAPSVTLPSFRATPDAVTDPAPAPALPAADGLVGTPVDPVFRDMQRRMDVLLQVGRPNLAERYAEAIREFEERRLQREESPAPPPTDDEIAAWNSAMHDWHDRHPGFAEPELGGDGGAWSIGWGLPGSGAAALGGTAAPGPLPGLADPLSAARLSGAASAPMLREGFREVR